MPERTSRTIMPPTSAYPPWAVLHVPHDSAAVPPRARGQLLLDDAALQAELVRMTDHHTHALFAGSESVRVVRAPVSRLVVDVERFADDLMEPMAARGMGVIYERTSTLARLRRQPTYAERGSLLDTYYWPHHEQLERSVAEALSAFGRCLVLDCHSFPSTALPYEQAPPGMHRPDICIGTDAFHTSQSLARAFVEAFQRAGWSVAQDSPFAGALVPASRYQRDARVQAVMVEVNRGLYLDERDGTRLPDFDRIAEAIRQCCKVALRAIT